MGHGWKDPGALKCFSIQPGGLGNQWDVQLPKHNGFQLPKKPPGTRGCFRRGDLGVSPHPPHPLPSATWPRSLPRARRVPLSPNPDTCPAPCHGPA